MLPKLVSQNLIQPKTGHTTCKWSFQQVSQLLFIRKELKGKVNHCKPILFLSNSVNTPISPLHRPDSVKQSGTEQSIPHHSSQPAGMGHIILKCWTGGMGGRQRTGSGELSRPVCLLVLYLQTPLTNLATHIHSFSSAEV